MAWKPKLPVKQWITEANHAGPPANVANATELTGENITAEFQAAHDFVTEVRLEATTVKTDDYTASAGELVLVDASAKSITVTLDLNEPDGCVVGVKAVGIGVDANGNPYFVAVKPTAPETFHDGTSISYLRIRNQCGTYTHDEVAAKWAGLSSFVTLDQLDSRYVSSASPQFTGTMQADQLKVGGIANQSSPLIFAGRTSSPGAPTTGTWQTNDVILDSNRAIHVCTSGGTPGIWDAGAPAAPTAATTAANTISQTTAQLTGTYNAHGVAGYGYFEVGPTTDYELGVFPALPGGALNSVEGSHTFTQVVSGLDPNTTYHFRFNVVTDGGSAQGADQTLLTLAANPPPVVTTSAASNVTSVSGTANGTVNPNGSVTTWWVEYGATNAYGNSTAHFSNLLPNNDYTTHSVSSVLSGYSAGQTVHYRIVAQNANGTTSGADQQFTTVAQALPTITALSSDTLTRNGGTVHATINPQNNATTYHIEYGTTTAYGSRIPGSDASVGSDAVGHAVSQTLSGLAEGTLIHWRVAATNTGGTAYSADQTLTTTTQFIKFTRTTYNNNWPRTLATDAQRCDILMVQATGTNPSAQADAIHAANSNCKVLVYMNLVFCVQSDAGLIESVPWATAEANNHALCCFGTCGHLLRTFNPDPTYRFVDVTLAATRDAMVSHVSSIISSGHYDGVFWDSCDFVLAWDNLRCSVETGTPDANGNVYTVPRAPAKYPTDGQFQDAVRTCLANIIPRLKVTNSGSIHVGNISPSGPTPTSPAPSTGLNGFYDYVNQLDGGYSEMGMGGLTGLLTDGRQSGVPWGSTSDYWTMNRLNWCDQTVNKIAMMHQRSATYASQVFNLAATMLISNGKTYFCLDHNLTNTDDWDVGTDPDNPTAFTKAQGSGAPLDPPQLQPQAAGADINLHVRRFTNCTVKVNFDRVTTYNGVPPLAARII